MDVQVDCGITDILEIYCKQFYSVCLDEEPEFYLKYKKYNPYLVFVARDYNYNNEDMDIKTTSTYKFF